MPQLMLQRSPSSSAQRTGAATPPPPHAVLVFVWVALPWFVCLAASCTSDRGPSVPEGAMTPSEFLERQHDGGEYLVFGRLSELGTSNSTYFFLEYHGAIIRVEYMSSCTSTGEELQPDLESVRNGMYVVVRGVPDASEALCARSVRVVR